MIMELSIRNFAIIDDVSVQFSDGLTVLTGETGAGKSIIIDALQLLTGSRASADFIRFDTDKAEIVGLFAIDKTNGKRVIELCDDYGIECEDDTLVLERTITMNGNNICRINGKIVALKVLRDIGRSLVSIHSQHDTIHLMDKNVQLELLDSYNDAAISKQKEKYLYVYKQYASLQKEYETLQADEQQVAHRLDLLHFQLKELEQANLTENEDEQLLEERNRLHNFEKIYRSVQEAYDALSGEHKGLDWVRIAKSALEQTNEVDEAIESYTNQLTNVYYTLEETSHALRDFRDQLYFDEARLNEIEGRLNELNRLKRKYGQTVNDMIAYYENIKREIDVLEHKDTHVEKLRTKIATVKEKALHEAKKLQALRKDAAKRLEKEIANELRDLYLENAQFSVQLMETEHETLTSEGVDQITFLLSTNVGEPLKELHKIASGGELSRIMLAFKKIFAKHDQIPTVIFDEIDTGVSGRVAQAIAEKMYQISMTTQTLCITHLPQVAAMSDVHLLIEKAEEEERVATMIERLDEKKKVEEIGRMITGVTLTDTALHHSEELLQLTNSFKRSLKS